MILMGVTHTGRWIASLALLVVLQLSGLPQVVSSAVTGTPEACCTDDSEDADCPPLCPDCSCTPLPPLVLPPAQVGVVPARRYTTTASFAWHAFDDADADNVFHPPRNISI